MTHVTASTPHPNDYIKSDYRMFFTFHPEQSSFLSGYLGINIATISGTLLIRLSQAIKAREINLYFIGREKIEWHKIKNEKIIVEKHEKLWTTTNPIGYELITDLTLPFEFQVPSDAIESFNSNFGSIQYTLKAIINKKQTRKKIWVEVIVPIWRWTQLSADEELRPLIIKSKNLQQRKLQIEWETILPKTFFDINSKFNAKLRMIGHSPNLRIKKIITCLKGIIKCEVDDTNFEKEQCWYKDEINGKDIIMIPNGLDTIFEVKVLIDIPNDVIPTCQTNYMKTINEIQIKVIFERSNTYVLITREILIGRNYNTESASQTDIQRI